MANYSRILQAAFLVTTTALGSVLAAHSNALAQSSDPGPPPTNATDGTEELKTADTATASSAAPTDGASELKPITVTGTHIRGARAAGAQLEIYTREDLDRSGYATVQDFIHTLPQNFQGGGGSEDASTGTLGTSNHFSGSSINLRGLGADSTLVLLNGRRMPNAGLEGNFIDISLLPQAAIERIEILPDGASALYGSDAIGGVVNFIMRKDYSGAETRLRYGRATESNTDEYRLSQAFGGTWSSGHAFISYEFYRRDFLTYGDRDYARSLDLRSQGGADYRYTLSSPGNILDLATFQPAYAIPSGQDGRNLTVDDLLPNQTNYQDRNPRGSLLPKQTRHSLFASEEQSITDNITIFADSL